MYAFRCSYNIICNAKTLILNTKSFSINKSLVESQVTLVIRSKEELEYARGLMRLHEQVVKPWLRQHAAKLNAQVGASYSRLFYVAGSTNRKVMGKSILNTRRNLEVTMHYPSGFIGLSADGERAEVRAISTEDRARFQDEAVPTQLARVSHFRDPVPVEEWKTLPFFDIHFDLNYFKCYLAPMLLPTTPTPSNKSSTKF
jgi:hypothetical protein